jgi:hypothetical protein
MFIPCILGVAEAFAREQSIRIVHGPDLAKLLPRVGRT